MAIRVFKGLSDKFAGATDRQRRTYVVMIGLALAALVAIAIVLTAPPKKKKDPPPSPVEASLMKAPQPSNDLEALNRKFNAEIQKRIGENKQREIAESEIKKLIEDMKASLKGQGEKGGGITDEQLEKAIRSRVDVKVTELANTGQISGKSGAGGFNAPVPNLGSPLPGANASASIGVPLLPRDDGGASPGGVPTDATAAAPQPKRKTMRTVSEGSPGAAPNSQSGGQASSGAAGATANAAPTNFAAPKGTGAAVAATNEVRAVAGQNTSPAGNNASTRDLVDTVSKKGGDDSTFLPLGSMITGVTLTGIDAPTSQAGQKNPVPMLIRIKHEAILPNRFRADLSECFVVASGFGSLSSGRAKLRTNAISCVRNDGKVVESQMSGYLIGEDGRDGVEGVVVSKTGDLLRNTLISGFLQAAATRLSGSTSTNLLTGAATGGAAGAGAAGIGELLGSGAEGAALGGAGQAIGSIAKMYAEMAKETQPVVEVLPGRAVTIVLTSGLTIRFGQGGGKSVPSLAVR